MRVIVVKTDNTFEIKDIKGELKDYQDIVGGYIEPVRPAAAYRHKLMTLGLIFIVDEEGHMKNKDTNLVGTYLYNGSFVGYPIAGDIMFIGETDEEFRGLTDDEIMSLTQLFRILHCEEVKSND